MYVEESADYYDDLSGRFSDPDRRIDYCQSGSGLFGSGQAKRTLALSGKEAVFTASFLILASPTRSYVRLLLTVHSS